MIDDDEGSVKDAKHPDVWPPALRFRCKTLNVKTVRRAKQPLQVLGVALAHNMRQGNEQHRHRYPIDIGRTPLNQILRGPDQAAVANEVALSTFEALEIHPPRTDTIVGLEMVFQPPAGYDTPLFWTTCLEWVDRNYEHLLSAVIHRDQRRPHMHVIVLAVRGGEFAGNALSAGNNRFPLQIKRFLMFMRDKLGLRTDRRSKTLADLAVSSGKGPKTRAAAAMHDAALQRRASASSREFIASDPPIDGHGGRCDLAATAIPTTPSIAAQPCALLSVIAQWADARLREMHAESVQVGAEVTTATAPTYQPISGSQPDRSTPSWVTAVGKRRNSSVHHRWRRALEPRCRPRRARGH